MSTETKRDIAEQMLKDVETGVSISETAAQWLLDLELDLYPGDPLADRIMSVLSAAGVI